MSGNSGDSRPSINRPSFNENCEDLVINTNLASPQPEVLALLNVGDELTIYAASDQGPIQALNSSGDVAGSIVSREQIRLLNCINQGIQYIAEVLSLDQGQCQVQIKVK